MLPSRRLFLKAVLCGLTSPLLADSRLVRAASVPKIIVIGAGAAGLAAARALTGQGFEVTVLEARQRIGGRIWTDHSLGVPLDLGASWIHGTEGNPLTKFARRLSQPLFDWDYENTRAIDLTGHHARALDHYDALALALEEIADANDDALTRLSVADAIARVRRQSRFKHLSKAELGFLTTIMVELEYAADADALSLAGVLEGSGFPGPDALLPNGYKPIVLGLAEGLTVLPGTTVDEVSYSRSGVGIRAGDREYSADYAICCLPLGVLKTNAIRFTPALPAAKRRAVDRLSMGVLNKVYLRFPEVFWDRDILNFGRISDRPQAFADWTNFFPVTGAPVLCTLNGGSFAGELDAMSELERREAAFDALKTMFGRDIPPPTGASSTAWRSDPFAKGSYSFLSVGTDPSEREALAAGLKSRLFFAGEATSTQYPATVHGAYLSGERAARQVIDAAR